MYYHVDFSPTAITLAARENWPTLTATVVTHRPSCRAVSATVAASPAPRPSSKVTPTAVVATPTSTIQPPCKAIIFVIPAVAPAPQPSRKDTFAAVVATPTPASRPLQKIIITAATLASMSARKPILWFPCVPLKWHVPNLG
ncbi:hypothetical protein ACLOJK_038872 [Asimina triloba]